VWIRRHYTIYPRSLDLVLFQMATTVLLVLHSMQVDAPISRIIEFLTIGLLEIQVLFWIIALELCSIYPIICEKRMVTCKGSRINSMLSFTGLSADV
jgi:hypothetical protein